MRSLLAALFVLVTTTGSAAAQGNPQTREGFWINFGFGIGSLGCDDCDDRVNGTTAHLRMGGTLSQRLLLGGEVNAWAKEEAGVTLSVAHVVPVLIFYPDANGGFYLKGGLGLTAVELDVGAISGEENGIGLILGLGYDARVGRNFALTPFFDIAVSQLDGGSLNRYSFGLGFTWP
jgi:hypothetical protein